MNGPVDCFFLLIKRTIKQISRSFCLPSNFVGSQTGQDTGVGRRRFAFKVVFTTHDLQKRKPKSDSSLPHYLTKKTSRKTITPCSRDECGSFARRETRPPRSRALNQTTLLTPRTPGLIYGKPAIRMAAVAPINHRLSSLGDGPLVRTFQTAGSFSRRGRI